MLASDGKSGDAKGHLEDQGLNERDLRENYMND